MSIRKLIEEAKGFLEGKELEMLLKLSEPENKAYDGYCQHMWDCAYNHVEKSEQDDPSWIRWFVQNIIAASSLPNFYYKSQTDRDELIVQINSLSQKLTRICRANGLDKHFVYRNEPGLKGFYLAEDLEGMHKVDLEYDEHLSFINALNMFASKSIVEVQKVDSRSKAGDRVDVRRFIMALAQQNTLDFGKPLYPIISTAALIIYGVSYAQSDISNLLNRKAQRKTLQN